MRSLEAESGERQALNGAGGRRTRSRRILFGGGGEGNGQLVTEENGKKGDRIEEDDSPRDSTRERLLLALLSISLGLERPTSRLKERSVPVYGRRIKPKKGWGGVWWTKEKCREIILRTTGGTTIIGREISGKDALARHSSIFGGGGGGDFTHAR